MADERQFDEKLLTFRSGGWVLLITGIAAALLIIWAVAPALFKHSTRGLGDGETVASYGFELTNAKIPKEAIEVRYLYRDLVAPLDQPSTFPGNAIDRLNREERGKILVGTDKVIGLEVNGEARAYPMSWMAHHHIANDVLGGTPVAVTYSPIAGAVTAFDRRVDDRTISFGVSGLIYNANLLMYDRHDDPEQEQGGESLWQQLTGEAIAGPAAAADLSLTPLPLAVTTWSQWLAQYPETTVIERDPGMAKRYKEITYDKYAQNETLEFAVDPPPPPSSELDNKDQLLVVSVDDQNHAFPLRHIVEQAGEQRVWIHTIGNWELTFIVTRAPVTAYVSRLSPLRDDTEASAVGDEPTMRYAYWFVWHAMFPESQPIGATTAAAAGHGD